MIKKIFGILLLTIGFVMLPLAVRHHFQPIVQFSMNTPFDSIQTAIVAVGSEPNMITTALAIGGIFLFVIGMIMATRRTDAQRKLAYEYEALKQHVEKNSIPDISVQIEKLARLKEKGLLTEEEFKREKGRVLG